MRRLIGAALVAALVLTVGVGVAGALGGLVAADGTITACVQKDSFNARIVPDGTACRSTEQLVTFNQRGSKGDQGTQGVQGVKGDPGEQGVPGPQGTDGTDGKDGKDGKDGGDLVGSPCSLPNGTPGTVEMTVAANGAISWTCHIEPPPSLCPSPLPTYANAVTACDPATGNVSITCNAGFANVDGTTANGCEVNLMTDPNNCGSVGNRVPSGLHANWACAAGAVVLVSCQAGYFNANGATADGCEFQTDSFEPNDTLATPSKLGSLSPGGSLSLFANLTPLNDDWFQFSTNGCSVFSLCHVLIQPSANVAGIVQITREDGLALAPNATDTTSVGHTYTIHVVAPAAYVSSYTISIQNT